MLNKLEQIDRRYEEIVAEMAKPEVFSDPRQIMKLAQEKAAIDDVVNLYRVYKKTVKSLEETQAMLDDSHDNEMLVMVKQEVHNLEEKRDSLQEELKRVLLTKDPNDERDVILEIRGGTGGDEAAR